MDYITVKSPAGPLLEPQAPLCLSLFIPLFIPPLLIFSRASSTYAAWLPTRRPSLLNPQDLPGLTVASPSPGVRP